VNLNASSLRLLKRLGAPDYRRTLSNVNRLQHLESTWRGRFEKLIHELEAIAWREMLDGRNPKVLLEYALPRFEGLVMGHSVDAMRLGIASAHPSDDGPVKVGLSRLAKIKPPPSKATGSLAQVMKMWDQWSKKKKLPPRQKEIAERAKQQYLTRVQSVWEKYSREFREGVQPDQWEVRHALREATKASVSRCNTIVNTESTYYYNRSRREIYDASEDVTHYLFLAIRDHATTKWCKSRTGLVFQKGSSLLNKNTPPCHWNCRSEILPLSPSNPQHLKLIEDPSLDASRKKLVPLPAGWGVRAA
jgi:SPP1 gp7 family putative phage head morphogenesis protein